MLSDLRFRLRALFDRSRMERELDDELRFHLERETEKHMRAGLPHAEAERLAQVTFGGMSRIKDDTRDSRGVIGIEVFQQDLRYAWRGLRSRPGFAIAVVLTLGLGIGANTAMFGIVDRLLFRPPAHLSTPDRVHRVFARYVWDGKERAEGSFAYTRFLDFSRLTRSFDRIAAATTRRLPVGSGAEAREMNVAPVSATLFDFFDARPALGRYFAPDEDRTPAGAPVAVLGYGFWQSRYGGRADVLGKSLHVGDAVYTIVGVAPEGFVGVTEEAAPAVFLPITAFASSRNRTYFQNYSWTWHDVVARRKPDASVAEASRDLSAAFAQSWELERQLEPSLPSAAKVNARAEAMPVLQSRGPEVGRDAKVVTWVMGVAFIVLLVACANVANLLLARAVSRRREIALRLALGVTRRRLLQQLLTESLLLAALGGIAGLAAAQWGGQALRALFLRTEDASAVMTDGRTLAFAALITLAVALLTGLAPAIHGIRGDVADSLKSGRREGTYRRSRLRSSLLLFQSAFSVVLLIGAGLFVRSLANVRALRLGYDLEPLVYVEAKPRGVNLSVAQANALAERIIEVAEATPGIRSASLAISVPFYSSEGRGAPFVPGRDSLHKLGRFTLQAGSAKYFQTLGTRIMRGRGISDADHATSAPVIVINEAMANAIWPGEDALGKQMRIGSDTNPYMTVVGVVENMRGRQLTGDAEFWYYLPIKQYLARFGSLYPYAFVRVSGRAEDYVETLRRRLQPLMPGESYVSAVPMRSLVSPRQRSWEFGATMFVAFGALALVLAAIGLYSVIAYAVAQRTHELGVRIALGAGLADVIRMIVGQGVAFAAAGVAIGSVIALWAGKWVEPLLFSQKVRDPLIYLAVAVALLIVALVATLRPALRATRVDPTVALRAD
ncbi:MAG TPA: ABC transporter permease [Gemmatimonadaceae bacterium]|nr:ABC transporter permease [Gemmatimonadaceae bacterium]